MLRRVGFSPRVAVAGHDATQSVGNSPPYEGTPTLDSVSMQQEWLRSRRGVRHLAFFGSQILFCTLALRHGVPVAYLLAWLAVCVTTSVVALRMRHAALVRAASGSMRGTTVLVLVIGCMISGPYLTLPRMTELELVVVTLWFYSIVAGVAASAAGWRSVYFAIAAALLPPLTYLWWPARGSVDPWFHGFVAVGTLAYGAILSGINREVTGLFRQSAEMNARLQAALQQTEEASLAKTRFLASASHDLRQPLHTVSLYCGALSTHALEPRSRQVIERMDEALMALSKQMDTLLDVSKLDAGIVQPQWAAQDLGALLDRLGQDFEPLAREKGLTLQVRSPRPLMVHTDPQLLERVLRNLIDNALKYTPQGSVAIEAAPQGGGRVGLRVADTGLGIPAAEQERVFEEFYQLNNPERDRRRGLGLGLSIVRRLACLLDIDMRLTSAPGQGTRFDLSLPAAEAEAEPAGLPPVAVRGAAVQGLRVLVLDDELSVRQSMASLLEGLGCLVELASGIEEACLLAAQRRPDVLLCDLRLRGSEDGLQAIARLRALHPRLPALLISGDTAAARLQQAHAAGIGLLHKPVAARVLGDAISRLAGRGAEAEDAWAVPTLQAARL